MPGYTHVLASCLEAKYRPVGTGQGSEITVAIVISDVVFIVCRGLLFSTIQSVPDGEILNKLTVTLSSITCFLSS